MFLAVARDEADGERKDFNAPINGQTGAGRSTKAQHNGKSVNWALCRFQGLAHLSRTRVNHFVILWIAGPLKYLL